jgi:uncharacterized membrane protein YgcG
MCSRRVRFGAMLLLSVFASIAGAAAPAEIPQALSLLVDDAGALTADERSALLRRLRTFQDEGRAQVSILISKSTCSPRSNATRSRAASCCPSSPTQGASRRLRRRR